MGREIGNILHRDREREKEREREYKYICRLIDLQFKLTQIEEERKTKGMERKRFKRIKKLGRESVCMCVCE